MNRLLQSQPFGESAQRVSFDLVRQRPP
jgi:hypothetical protein